MLCLCSTLILTEMAFPNSLSIQSPEVRQGARYSTSLEVSRRDSLGTIAGCEGSQVINPTNGGRPTIEAHDSFDLPELDSHTCQPNVPVYFRFENEKLKDVSREFTANYDRAVDDRALRNELQTTIREAKDRAAQISEPAELWELEDWLAERRQDIDRRYDYRYSVLPIVFAHLIRDGRLKEDDLKGLCPEKVELISRSASLA